MEQQKRGPGRPKKKKDGTNEPDESCQIGVRINKQNWNLLKRIAATLYHQEKSATSIINELIADYVQRHEKSLRKVESVINSTFKKG